MPLRSHARRPAEGRPPDPALVFQAFLTVLARLATAAARRTPPPRRERPSDGRRGRA